MVRLEGFYARALLRRQEKGNASGDAKLRRAAAGAPATLVARERCAAARRPQSAMFGAQSDAERECHWSSVRDITFTGSGR
jgi:hypothetical protein